MINAITGGPWSMSRQLAEWVGNHERVTQLNARIKDAVRDGEFVARPRPLMRLRSISRVMGPANASLDRAIAPGW